MGLDRDVLARADRRLLAGFGGVDTWRMVRVPMSPAMWSTWKRYCDSAGISMGRAIAILIGQELAGVLGDLDRADPFGPSTRAGELARREAEFARREQEAEAAEGRLRTWDEHLGRRERDLDSRERRAASTAASPILPEQLWSRVGRNEACPCGSGRTYKRCHG